jgi:hypothetical protein
MSDKNKRYFYLQTDIHFWSYLTQFLSEGEMLQTKVVKKNILYTIIFFKNRAVNEIAWKNITEPGRPQMTIWRTCTTCWIPNAKNTHSEYVILNAFSSEQWLPEHASMLHYTNTVCLSVCVVLKTYSGCHFLLHIKTDMWPQRLTMIQVFWNVMLYNWVNRSQSFKGPSWDEAFQKGQPTPEKVHCIGRATG